MKRRAFLIGSMAAGTFGGSSDRAWSQSPRLGGVAPRTDREIRGVLTQAGQLNLAGPRAAGQTDPLHLADIIERALAKGTDNEDAANLALRAGLLLSELTRDLRDGLDFVPSDPIPAATRYPYTDELKREYENLFRTARIKSSSAGELKRVAEFVTSSRPKERYKQVEHDTGVPWYVIGALHYREANLNFMGHLHNGDALLLQTVHVEAKRPPKPWIPPDVSDPEQLWRLSAKDALRRLSKSVKSWTVQRMCYAFESFNGFGCRSYGIKSPYLWNYTNYYSQGGFPRDHVFDANYRSRQAGVIAIIVKLQEVDPAGVELKFDA
jgi:lysozyme family protein